MLNGWSGEEAAIMPRQVRSRCVFGYFSEVLGIVRSSICRTNGLGGLLRRGA